jgi:hypothetical protein
MLPAEIAVPAGGPTSPSATARTSNSFMKTRKTAKPPKPRRSLQDVVRRLTEAVNKAKGLEVELNRHLGHADDYHKGSLAVSLRWDDVAALLESKSPNDSISPTGSRAAADVEIETIANDPSPFASSNS